MSSYTTIQGRAVAEIEEKKSRFIASLAHVETEEEALAFLEEIRAANRMARHNVYAYILRQGGAGAAGRVRYSDDGEPQKTAGLPTLEVLQHAGLTDVVCVVTRYFGGVLLGAGGLVRAYTQGAVVALKAAQVVEMLPSCQYLCEVAYPLWDKVQYALKSLPVQLLSSEFTTAVGFTLLIRQTDAQSVLDTLTRVTDGRIETLLEEESYRAWDSESK
ncbi:IMPACT family protein [Senegalimassilia anaerobia]|uniref:IMPACT family protein n=1 Tax=Senegalimassilia anaerobia TaxID=1473216 RepID=UPI003A985C53